MLGFYIVLNYLLVSNTVERLPNLFIRDVFLVALVVNGYQNDLVYLFLNDAIERNYSCSSALAFPFGAYCDSYLTEPAR